MTNLLPQDGIALYNRDFLSLPDSNLFLELFANKIPWVHDRIKIYGKEIVTQRKVAWFGDEGVSYKYSQVTKRALPWTEELLALKQKVEEEVNEKYNSC